MKQVITNTINGKHLYYSFLAGGNNVLQNQKELNRINVFPVSDKDTGTNLASTIRSVLDNLTPHKSYKTTIDSIAEAALIGARGNSGVIFAQFFYGLSKATQTKPIISLGEFAKSVRDSIPYIYEAIANPVEGTILTVIKDWSNYINNKKDGIQDFKVLLNESSSVLEKSLSETTFKLKELNKHGFVDAGAKGFVLFIKGIIDFINNRNVENLALKKEETVIIHTEEFVEEDFHYRYCTEAVFRNISIKKKDLKNRLKDEGDSVVIAGSENLCRIHIHTNHPASLFHKLKDIGTITYQKVDDMIRQQDIAFNRKWNIAIVTDSTCDLSQELLDHYQINMVPINLNFGENHYLDKITIQPEQFYSLLESSDEFPKTSQINERSFANVYSHLASHYDAIIGIHLSSQFSGTFSSSLKAARRISEEFSKPIHVIDSKNISGGLGLVVLKAAMDLENGLTYKEIVTSLEKYVINSKIFVSVKNLKYMIKGGRVSKPKGFIANTLGLNPVISVDENGKSLLFGNTFSQNSSLKKIFNHILKLTSDKKVWNYIVMHAHNVEGAKEVEEKMIHITQKTPISVVDISPVIGMHAGNGAVAVSVLFNN